MVVGGWWLAVVSWRLAVGGWRWSRPRGLSPHLGYLAAAASCETPVVRWSAARFAAANAGFPAGVCRIGTVPPTRFQRPRVATARRPKRPALHKNRTVRGSSLVGSSYGPYRAYRSYRSYRAYRAPNNHQPPTTNHQPPTPPPPPPPTANRQPPTDRPSYTPPRSHDCHSRFQIRRRSRRFG